MPGFKLYSWIFGVKYAFRICFSKHTLTSRSLSEVSEPDLHVYPNLASFFYRTLKPGVRPLDPNQNALLSPADGRILQFGAIENGDVEQVKGMTYSLDALLGTSKSESSLNPANPANVFKRGAREQSSACGEGDEEIIKQDEEFATVNGISYTLPNLFSGPPQKQQKTKTSDASTKPTSASEAEVRAGSTAETAADGGARRSSGRRTRS